jgi:hypothetical protein
MKGETSMSMIWKDPFEALMPLREAVNRLFEDSFVWPGRFRTLDDGQCNRTGSAFHEAADAHSTSSTYSCLWQLKG